MNSVLFRRDAETFHIAAVEVGVVAEAAISVSVLNGRTVLDLLPSYGQSLDEYIIPESAAGDFFEAFIQIGFTDAELFTEFVQGKVFCQMRVDVEQNVLDCIGDADTQCDGDICHGAADIAQGGQRQVQYGQDRTALVGRTFLGQVGQTQKELLEKALIRRRDRQKRRGQLLRKA